MSDTLSTTLRPMVGVMLQLASEDQAAFLEELLWTLDGVTSVMYKMDGEIFQGMQVIAANENLAVDIQALLALQQLSEQVTIDHIQQIQEEDWAESWKQYWHVNRILPHLVIQPSWETFTPTAGDIVLRLDPGSAFGTGTHETTQLVLYLLDEIMKGTQHFPCKMIDVGTGSGILAIYAAKLGVKDIVAIDNDPQAVAVSRQNVQDNGVEQTVRCSVQPLSDFEKETFDFITANILAPVLQEMMAQFKQMLSSDGTLILSGINRQQVGDMAASIRRHGLKLQRVLQKGDWVALVCQRP